MPGTHEILKPEDTVGNAGIQMRSPINKHSLMNNPWIKMGGDIIDETAQKDSE
tara:strand:- start:737 stop:895 length:159 start_codon:yes stop_codon:yes gene_type:complete